MASATFIDYAYAQFHPAKWQEGVSIYFGNSVTQVNLFGELVSAVVRAGGRFDVRMKLNGHGRCVQWMECSCPDYRRRNQKCGHLAAVCLYLDRDRGDLLHKLNLVAGVSDKYLLTPKEAKAIPEPVQATEGARTNAPGDPLEWLSEVQRNEKSRIKQVTFEKMSFVFLVTIELDNRKDVTYRLSLDEFYPIFQSKRFHKFFQFESPETSTVHAKRFFEIAKVDDSNIKVTRCVGFFDAQDQLQFFEKCSGFKKNQLGIRALYHEKHGLLAFKDAMTTAQIARWEEYPNEVILDSDNAASLLQTGFKRLKETSEIKVDPALQELKVFQQLTIDTLHLTETGEDTFSVKPDFDRGALGGTQPSLLAVLKARAAGKKFVKIEKGWVEVSEDLDWLVDKVAKDGTLKLSTLELIKFKEQFAENSSLKGEDEAVRRIGAGLVKEAELVLPDLGTTRLSLRPYQQEGLRWLWWLYQNKLGGLLADEMGLGKTHQAMALLASIAQTKTKSMFLVVCPTSVIDHWIDKMREFVPNVPVFLYYGIGRRIDALNAGQHGQLTVITSYGILLRDIELLTTYKWEVVILDEAHLVKNQTTRTYKAALKLKSRMRLCLTGTPIENDLLELKNLFDYIVPSYLGSDPAFRRRYLKEGDKNPLGELELKRLIHPFKLRRNKSEVLDDLPEKVEDIRHCHLNPKQFALYQEALSLKGQKTVEDLRNDQGPIPYIHVFAILSLLKQICNDPALIDERYESYGSGKLELFDELLSEALASGHKVVVFSQYAKMVARLSQRLSAQNIGHVTLTGATQKRGDVIKTFQTQENIKVFLGSLLAGGTGIDLTAASVVIHFDRWWNAAKENQATDRIHRIGQTKNVQVFKLVTRGSLEERIDQIIERKKVVFDKFIEGDKELFQHLSREDLLSLLAPPETEESSLSKLGVNQGSEGVQSKKEELRAQFLFES